MLKKLKRAIGRLLHAPRPEIVQTGNLIRLGSEYGGWTFRPDAALAGTTIVSAGLGEDASFDTEFAKMFDARVIIVDPTPRAVAHYRALVARAGSARSRPYAAGGCQPVEAYPLDGVDAGQLVLEPRALWSEETRLSFYSPPDPAHVSHSLVDFQNDYSKQGASIEVATTTLSALLKTFGIARLQLLKLDIEGAEFEVLGEMLDQAIRPVQLLIEFDELTLRTKLALERWREMDGRLREAGYVCGYFDGRSCFLYLLAP